IEKVEPLLRYLARPDPLNVLVVIAESIKSSTELYRLIEKEGVVVEFPKVAPWDKEAKLQVWVVNYLKDRKVKILPKVALKLARGISGGYTHFVQELEKLLAYIGLKNEITDDDLNAIATIDLQNTLWQLSDALFEQSGQALLLTLSSL